MIWHTIYRTLAYSCLDLQILLTSENTGCVARVRQDTPTHVHFTQASCARIDFTEGANETLNLRRNAAAQYPANKLLSADLEPETKDAEWRSILRVKFAGVSAKRARSASSDCTPRLELGKCRNSAPPTNTQLNNA